MYQPKLNYNSNGIPVISNAELDDLGEKLVADYLYPKLLQPSEIDIDRFVLKYLHMKQDFQYLSHCGVYLGVTIFQATNSLPVYIPEKNCADYVSEEANTVVIDSSLGAPEAEHRYRFTMGHEGSHSILHPSYFLNTIGASERDATGIYVRCRSDFSTSSVNGLSRSYSLSDTMRVEQQANRLSSAILMPKSMTRLLLARKPYTGRERWLLEAMSLLSETFNVSSEAAFYRMKELAIIPECTKLPYNFYAYC